MTEIDPHVNHEVESASSRRRRKHRSEREKLNKMQSGGAIALDGSRSPSKDLPSKKELLDDEYQPGDSDAMFQKSSKPSKILDANKAEWNGRPRKNSLEKADTPQGKSPDLSNGKKGGEKNEDADHRSSSRQHDSARKAAEKVLSDFPELCSRIQLANSEIVSTNVLGTCVNVAKQQLTGSRFGMTHCAQAQSLADQLSVSRQLLTQYEALETTQSCDEHLRAFRQLVSEMQVSSERLADEVARANSCMHILLALAQTSTCGGAETANESLTADTSSLNDTVDSSAFDLISSLIDELGSSHDVRELLSQLATAKPHELPRICNAVAACLIDTSLLKRLSQLNESFRMQQREFRLLFQRLTAEPRRRYALVANQLLADSSAHWNAHVRFFVTEHDALCSQAVCWIERLLFLTLQLVDFGTSATISDDDLWQINRGIEDALALIRLHKPVRPLPSYRLQRRYARSRDVTETSEKKDRRNGLRKRDRGLDFLQVLEMIAHERSKRFAQTAANVVINDSRLINALKRELTSRSVRKQLDMESSASSFTDCVQLPNSTVQANGSVYDDVLTLDWFGMLYELLGNSKSAQAAKSKMHRHILLDAVAGFDPQCLTDARNNQSVLQELVAEEQTFVDRLLSNALQSTSLMRRGKATKRAAPNSNVNSNVNGNLPATRARMSSQFLFGAQGDTRKSVNWSDAIDSSYRAQFIAHYFDTLWSHAGCVWHALLKERSWGQRCGNTRSLACVHCLPPLLCISVLKCFQSLVEYDPLLSNVAASDALVRLQCEHAHSLWHAAMCNALGSRRSDILQRRVRHSLVLSSMSMHFDDIEQCGAGVRHLWNATVIQLCHLVDIVRRAEPQVAMPSEFDRLAKRVANGGIVFLAWLSSDGYRDLQSSDLSNFLRLLCSDYRLMNYILCLSQRVFRNSAQVCDEQSQSQSQSSPPSRTASLLLKCTDSLEQSVKLQRDWQAVCTQQLAERFRVTAFELISHSMPSNRNKKAQIWRLNSHADATNEYVDEVIEYLVQETISNLFLFRSLESRQTVLLMLVNAVCDSWMRCILEDRAKFSVAGAALLQKHLQAFLDKTLDTVRSHYPSTSQSSEAEQQLAQLEHAVCNADSVARFRTCIAVLAAEKTPPEAQRSARSTFACSCGSAALEPQRTPFGSSPNSGRTGEQSLTSSRRLGSTSSLNANKKDDETEEATSTSRSRRTELDSVKWEKLRADYPEWKLLPFCS